MAKSQWSEKLIAKWQDRDIASQIDKLQSVYRKWVTVCIAITAGGTGMMMTTDNSRVIAIGLFLAITGMVNIALMKTWSHIKISMLRVVWEIQEQKKAHSG